jgi:hypothetical protein
MTQHLRRFDVARDGLCKQHPQHEHEESDPQKLQVWTTPCCTWPSCRTGLVCTRSSRRLAARARARHLRVPPRRTLSLQKLVAFGTISMMRGTVTQDGRSQRSLRCTRLFFGLNAC